MKKLQTKHFLQKKIASYFLNEKGYNNIKLYKIIWDYKRGKPYDKVVPLFPKFINSDGIIFDIGANMGQYACRLNNFVPNGKVYCFEPVNNNYKSLVKIKSLLRLKNIVVLKLAISDSVGEEKICIPIISKRIIIGTQAVLEKNIKNDFHNVNYIKEKTKTNTINNLMSELKLKKLDFIKMDTEGSELRVLKGGNATIKKHKPIMQLEINYNNEGLNHFYEAGYKPYYIIGNNFVEAKKAISITSRLGNVILIHNDRKRKLMNIIN